MFAKTGHVATSRGLRQGSEPSARRRKGRKRRTTWLCCKVLRFIQAHSEARSRGQEPGELSLCRKTAGAPGRVEQSRQMGRLSCQKGKRSFKGWPCSKEPENPQEPSGRESSGQGPNYPSRKQYRSWKPTSLDPVGIPPKLESLLYPSC